jgi:hypothetical protein
MGCKKSFVWVAKRVPYELQKVFVQDVWKKVTAEMQKISIGHPRQKI